MMKIILALIMSFNAIATSRADATPEGNYTITSVAVGSFESTFKDLNGNEYHHFKSHDDTVWWALTAEEIGFTPEANKTYTLLYDNNGTTDCTECAEELECECEVYDDIFIKVM